MIANISKEKIIIAIESLKPVAQFLTRNNSEADELVDETLIRAIENQDCYYGGLSIKAWLYTIMRNIYINDKRYKRRFKNIRLRAPVDYYDFERIQKGHSSKSRPANNSLFKNIVDIVVTVFPDVFRFKLEFYYLGYIFNELIDYFRGQQKQEEEFEEQQAMDN